MRVKNRSDRPNTFISTFGIFRTIFLEKQIVKILH